MVKDLFELLQVSAGPRDNRGEGSESLGERSR